MANDVIIEGINDILVSLGEPPLTPSETVVLEQMLNNGCLSFTNIPCDYYKYIATLLGIRASGGTCEMEPFLKLLALAKCANCSNIPDIEIIIKNLAPFYVGKISC